MGFMIPRQIASIGLAAHKEIEKLTVLLYFPLMRMIRKKDGRNTDSEHQEAPAWPRSSRFKIKQEK